MTEKALTEMTEEEIIAEIQLLRERRAQARERRVTAASPAEKHDKKGKKVDEVGGELGNLLDDILGDG